MSTNVLNKIVADKRDEVAALKARRPMASFIQALKPSTRDFAGALAESQTSFILECKKASPSKGLIREHFDLAYISSVYSRHATCISVLTDGKYFQGKLDYLKFVSERVTQPVIGKDFYVDTYQVYLARYYGADAVLLMLSVLSDDEYRELAEVAKTLNMSILTEVSNQDETERALALDASLIGINNRNLRDLSTDLATTESLVKLIPDDVVVISESGIYTHSDVQRLAPLCQGFLVGSSLMAEPDLNAACNALIYGEHKVCGLTRGADAREVSEAGGTYGGLIFAPQSARCVSLDQAETIMAQSSLRFVGVFVNQPAEEIAHIAAHLGLYAVQLHGQEDDSFIRTLRKSLPADVQIWQALPVENTLPDVNTEADRVLLDSKNPQGFGGTGQTFDWSMLNDLDQASVILAGGLGPGNISQAIHLHPYSLDINSGVESAPGIKDANKVRSVFSQLRAY